MPLKLHVGLSKKVGLPNYGSIGASCHLEMELDAHLITRDRNDFDQQVQQAFEACSKAVQEELERRIAPSRHKGSAEVSANAFHGNGEAEGSPDGAPHDCTNNDPCRGEANGRAAKGEARPERRRATRSQVRVSGRSNPATRGA